MNNVEGDFVLNMKKDDLRLWTSDWTLPILKCEINPELCEKNKSLKPKDLVLTAINELKKYSNIYNHHILQLVNNELDRGVYSEDNYIDVCSNMRTSIENLIYERQDLTYNLMKEALDLGIQLEDLFREINFQDAVLQKSLILLFDTYAKKKKDYLKTLNYRKITKKDKTE